MSDMQTHTDLLQRPPIHEQTFALLCRRFAPMVLTIRSRGRR
jgi:hypothetical protein